MAKQLQFTRFCNPESVANVSNRFLNQLIRPHVAGIRAAGTPAPDGDLTDDQLRDVLSGPESLPAALIEQLAQIDQLASPRNFDALLESVGGLGCEPGENITAGDLVVMLILQAPEVIERLSAELQRYTGRRFDAYVALGCMPPQLRSIDGDREAHLERAITRELGASRGGHGVRVHSFSEAEGFRLMIRRGHALVCEPSIDRESGETRRIMYTPEGYDVILYDLIRGELKISARRSADIPMYLRAVGDAVFGDSTLFVGDGLAQVYGLDALRDGLGMPLFTGGVPELSRAYVTSLKWRHRGGLGLVTNWTARDVQQSLRATGVVLPRDAELLSASFRLVKQNGKHFVVTLTPPVSIRVTQEADLPLAQRFLTARGMCNGKEAAIRGLTLALLQTA